MKAIDKIMVFDNDINILFMLRGYCYAHNIQMAEVQFTKDGIHDVESFNPDLILIPLECFCTVGKISIETDLLRMACDSREVKIWGLQKNSSDIASATVPEWIDVTIKNPLDIVEIDKFLKISFVCNSYLPERRSYKERRSNTDRRQYKLMEYGYDENKEATAKNPEDEGGNSVASDFHVDVRNKRLIVKGHKIDLTPKEFELIECLSTEPDRVFTPDEIIKRVWPENHRATKSDLYQYIHLLRKKIEKDHNHPQLIVNAKGFGYKLNVLNRQDPYVSGVYQVA